jgi:hypothetical protein
MKLNLMNDMFGIDIKFSRPFRALQFLTAIPQGIALWRSALGWVLAAHWAAFWIHF